MICMNLHQIWSCPLQIVLCMYFLIDFLGVSALAGLAVMLLLIPVNKRVARLLMTYRKRCSSHTDSRVKAMNETLSGIRVIKFYAWVS